MFHRLLFRIRFLFLPNCSGRSAGRELTVAKGQYRGRQQILNTRSVEARVYYSWQAQGCRPCCRPCCRMGLQMDFQSLSPIGRHHQRWLRTTGRRAPHSQANIKWRLTGSRRKQWQMCLSQQTATRSTGNRDVPGSYGTRFLFVLFVYFSCYIIMSAWLALFMCMTYHVSLWSTLSLCGGKTIKSIQTYNITKLKHNNKDEFY